MCDIGDRKGDVYLLFIEYIRGCFFLGQMFLLLNGLVFYIILYINCGKWIGWLVGYGLVDLKEFVWG